MEGGHYISQILVSVTPKFRCSDILCLGIAELGSTDQQICPCVAAVCDGRAGTGGRGRGLCLCLLVA